MSIASDIKDDLVTRLRSGRNLSFQLTPDSPPAYDAFRLTPVLRAVSEPIDDRVSPVRQNRDVLTALLEHDSTAAHRAWSDRVVDNHLSLNRIAEGISDPMSRTKRSQVRRYR